MKYVNRIVRPSGEVQLYLRKKGLPAIRLTQAEDSDELQAEVDALVRALSTPRPLGGGGRSGARPVDAQTPGRHREGRP